MLILFAAGLVAHGIHEFNEIDWIPPVIEHVWDVNAIIDENSIPANYSRRSLVTMATHR